MKVSLKTALAVIGVCLLPLTAVAQKVSVDCDKDADLSKYSTYTWRAGRAAPNPLVDRRILGAIDRQLASKGWTQTHGAPQAIVVYTAGMDVQRQLNGFGSGPRWSGVGTVRMEEQKIGQLLVDIYDAATGRLLWRGFASDTVSDKPEKNEKRINDAAAKLFRQFPPARTTTTGTK
jgi:Domain of unknown function (DUF4136)